jgi:hypothetical protein
MTSPFDREVRLMLQAAMLIFVYTIGVGILNGLDIVEFNRRMLLAHLHGGTLGWMTLAILSATLWLFSMDSPMSETGKKFARGLAYLAPIAIAGYVLAFGTTFGIVRPIAGIATLTLLIGFAVWAFARSRSATLNVPQLFVLVGLTSSVLGGSFGVLNGLALARGWDWVPSSFFDAHPGTMEIGFVIPVAMGLAEWGMRRNQMDQPAPLWGFIQVGLMFAAFAVILAAILAEADAMVGIGTLIAVVAVIVFFVRMWPHADSIWFVTRGPERHALAAGVMLGVTIAYITVIINLAQGVFEDIPRGQTLAFIHLMAVATTTNAILAFVVFLSSRVRPLGLVDDVIFGGINIGVIGFVIALTLDVTPMVHLFVPIMGSSLLLAIGVHLVALGKRPAGEQAEERAARAGEVSEPLS